MCVLGLTYAFVTEAHATVFEYDSEGNLTVTETKRQVPGNSTVARPSPPSIDPALRALTRKIALEHSGASGVRKAGLDALTFVDVFEALVEQESSFDPNAVSEDGAMGLGQLMPDTAKGLKVTDPFDPNQNLIGSVRYLTQQLERFGSLELALAAYNAGPEKVVEHEGVPPFSETRDYIAKVFKSAGINPEPAIQTQPRPVSVPINKEKPLNGDVSVWEF